VVSGSNLGGSSIGLIQNYSGPTLFMNGEPVNTEGKMFIDFNTLRSASSQRLREIYNTVQNRPLYVIYADNSIREYSVLESNGEIVYLPAGGAPEEAGRGIASTGEEAEEAPPTPEGREFKADILEDAIDTTK